jgi:pyrroline-5-carboxylate reductase
MKKITIIGGGNLGTAIAEGLIESGFIKAKDLTVTRRNVKALEKLSKKGVITTSDNKSAIESANLIIVALKPYQVREFLKEHSYVFKNNQVIVSTVTGTWLKELRDCIGAKGILFRAMPNTAIAIKESMTCIAYEKATDQQIRFVKDIFEKLGKVVFIEEKLMDAATVLGACGTAFAMRYIRANIQGGVEIGFDAVTATFISAQTIKGAAQMLLQHKTHPEQEIDKVATPKGCTIAGLNEMEHQGFSSSLIKGLVASYDKISEL